MSENENTLPTRYYVDFENVHGPGLKGIDELGPDDVVYIFFSQAAETFHIEHAIGIMNSKARVEFVEIDGGTRNALDFQLVAALFAKIEEGAQYAIVSGDVGFDAAIRMGERLDLPTIRRISDLTGSTEPVQAKASRRRSSKKQSRAADAKAADAKATAGQPEQAAAGQPEQATAGRLENAAEHAGPENKDSSGKQAGQKTASARRQHQLPSSQAPDTAEGQPPAEPKADEASAKKAEGNGGERSGRYSKRKEVKALLAENGVTLNQQQLSSVMKSLNGVKNKQQFYRSVIQSEGQERGLELYRRVRDHYEAMRKALQA